MQNTSLKKFRFPSISRVYTEVLVIFGFLSCVVLLFLVVALYNLYATINQKTDVDTQRQSIVSQIKVWERIVGAHSDYRDGYFKLAELEYKLGNKEKARVYVKKTLALDPMFEAGREFEKILETD